MAALYGDDSIENAVSLFVEGFKESQRLDRMADRAQNDAQAKTVRDKRAINENQTMKAGMDLLSTLLVDLHRIANAMEKANGNMEKAGELIANYMMQPKKGK
jgi:hypothetical protein